MMGETAEEISKRPEVRKELQRTTGGNDQPKIKARGRDKFWLVVHLIILAGCAVAYFLVESKVIPVPQSSFGIATRFLRGAALVVIVLAIAGAVSVYMIARIEDPSTHFTLQRITHLIVALVIAMIVISVVFVNWYAALATLGVGSITWLEAIVRYLVAPREAGRVKTRLIKKLLAALNADPEKVMFPAGANR